jgi:hypothetical protein
MSNLPGGVIGAIGAAGGTLGVTRASMTATVERDLQSWGELMWNQSLAAVICREMLTVEELPAPTARHWAPPQPE